MPRIAKDSNLNSYSYFLSSPQIFFHRQCSNAFSSKWHGLWQGEKKLVEYFALKCNNFWLAPENCKKIEYDFASSTHYYEFNGLQVKETIFAAESEPALVVVLEADRECLFEAEIAFNIRKMDENLAPRKYSFKQSGNFLSVENELGKAFFAPLLGRFSAEKSFFEKEHFPSGEKQHCLVAEKIFLKGKRIAFAFSPEKINSSSAALLKELKQKRKKFRESSLFESDNKQLEEFFYSALASMELLKARYKNSGLYFAGLPWFAQFWGRDEFWFAPALTDLGKFEEARQALEAFSKNSVNGRIANFLPEAFNSIDATLLWIEALHSYFYSTGDNGFLLLQKDFLKKCFAFLESRRSREGFLLHDFEEKETWNDTLDRKAAAVEVQALYLNALQKLSELFISLGESELAKKCAEHNVVLAENFEKEFFSNGFCADRIVSLEENTKDFSQTANALVPLVFRQFSQQAAEAILGKIGSEEFSTAAGVRIRALNSAGFEPMGYHTGRVWSLCTAWAAAAEYSYARKEQGFNYFKTLCSDLQQNAIGCISETFDSFNLQANGCLQQLWAIGFVIRIIDEWLLGIRVDALNKKIYCRPMLPASTCYVKRTKKILGKNIELLFACNGRVTAKGLPKGFELIAQQH